MAGNPSSNRWDLSNWTSGPVTLFQALGIKKGTISLPQLQPSLTEAALGSGAMQPSSSDTSSSGSGTGSGTSNVTLPASGTCNAAQTKANQTLGQQLAQSFGWGSGPQWSALNNIVMGESGWCNTIQNPDSTAYGIGQFVDTTWASTGYTKTSSPKTQILAMLAYIKIRYGDPANAWAFHQANGFY